MFVSPDKAMRQMGDKRARRCGKILLPPMRTIAPMKILFFAAAMSGFLLAGAATAQDAPPPPPPAAQDSGAPMHDADHGPISRADYLARADKRFDRMDANQDGFITADELGGMGRRGGNGGAPAGGGGFAQRMLDRMDTNHDGKVSKDEFRAEAAARFDQADTNHDGVLDENEQAAMRSQMGGRMAGMRDRRQRHADGDSAPPPSAPTPNTDQ
jgi:hypothetical protein